MVDAKKLLPCPFCGGNGRMVHPMGESLFGGPPYYGPDGSRITCTSPASVCCAMTASFHGPDQDSEAIGAWNTRKSDLAARVIELEAENAELRKQADALAGALQHLRDNIGAASLSRNQFGIAAISRSDRALAAYRSTKP